MSPLKVGCSLVLITNELSFHRKVRNEYLFLVSSRYYSFISLATAEKAVFVLHDSD